MTMDCGAQSLPLYLHKSHNRNLATSSHHFSSFIINSLVLPFPSPTHGHSYRCAAFCGVHPSQTQSQMPLSPTGPVPALPLLYVQNLHPPAPASLHQLINLATAAHHSSSSCACSHDLPLPSPIHVHRNRWAHSVVSIHHTRMWSLLSSRTPSSTISVGLCPSPDTSGPAAPVLTIPSVLVTCRGVDKLVGCLLVSLYQA